MEDIQWLHLYLKLFMEDLNPLSEILKGNSDLSSPRYLTDAVRQALAQVEHTIQHQQVPYVDYVES